MSILQKSRYLSGYDSVSCQDIIGFANFLRRNQEVDCKVSNTISPMPELWKKVSSQIL